jgi:hypothetical protein
MKFTRNHDLNRHRKTHSLEKHFTCEDCDRKFARRDALKRHQGMGDGGKKYHCSRPEREVQRLPEGFHYDDAPEAPNPSPITIVSREPEPSYSTAVNSRESSVSAGSTLLASPPPELGMLLECSYPQIPMQLLMPPFLLISQLMSLTNFKTRD